jgi:hypothetical protein
MQVRPTRIVPVPSGGSRRANQFSRDRLPRKTEPIGPAALRLAGFLQPLLVTCASTHAPTSSRASVLRNSVAPRHRSVGRRIAGPWESIKTYVTPRSLNMRRSPVLVTYEGLRHREVVGC